MREKSDIGASSLREWNEKNDASSFRKGSYGKADSGRISLIRCVFSHVVELNLISNNRFWFAVNEQQVLSDLLHLIETASVMSG